MGCCGQKRAALRSGRETAAFSPEPGSSGARRPGPAAAPGQVIVPPAEPTAPAAAAGQGNRLIEYTERSRISVRGRATGKVYEFSGAAPVQPVDHRDAAGMLATRFFRPSFKGLGGRA